MMAGPGGNGGVLLQDLADSLERSKGRRADGIRDGVVRAGPAALGPHEVVLVALQQHERAFDVTRRRDLLERAAVGEGNEARKIRIQLRDVAVPPAAVNDVVRAITILEYHLIDRLRTVVKPVDQRLAEVVRERTRGRSSAGDPDAADLLVVLDVVRAEEQVVPAVLFDDRRRPDRALRPRHVGDVEDARVLLPGDEVVRGESVEKGLLVVRRRIRWKDPVLSAEDMRFGVGVPAGENGIAGARRLLGGANGGEDDEQR